MKSTRVLRRRPFSRPDGRRCLCPRGSPIGVADSVPFRSVRRPGRHPLHGDDEKNARLFMISLQRRHRGRPAVQIAVRLAEHHPFLSVTIDHRSRTRYGGFIRGRAAGSLRNQTAEEASSHNRPYNQLLPSIGLRKPADLYQRSTQVSNRCKKVTARLPESSGFYSR